MARAQRRRARGPRRCAAPSQHGRSRQGRRDRQSAELALPSRYASAPEPPTPRWPFAARVDRWASRVRPTALWWQRAQHRSVGSADVPDLRATGTRRPGACKRRPPRADRRRHGDEGRRRSHARFATSESLADEVGTICAVQLFGGADSGVSPCRMAPAYRDRSPNRSYGTPVFRRR